jgi:hypothetical protein
MEDLLVDHVIMMLVVVNDKRKLVDGFQAWNY